MSEPMERHISITSTTTNTNGVVTQVTHASVHVVASGDCFDPETCCDERERALIAAMRAYLRPKHAPQSLIDRLEATINGDSAGFSMFCSVIHAGRDQAFGRLP